MLFHVKHNKKRPLSFIGEGSSFLFGERVDASACTEIVLYGRERTLKVLDMGEGGFFFLGGGDDIGDAAVFDNDASVGTKGEERVVRGDEDDLIVFRQDGERAFAVNARVFYLVDEDDG